MMESTWNAALPDTPRRVGVQDFRDETRGELVFLAMQDGIPVGFLSVWEASCFVHHLFVDPMFQGRGIGSCLLRHAAVLSGDRPLSLKCQTENRSAIQFYERHGFHRTELRGSDKFGDWIELRTNSA